MKMFLLSSLVAMVIGIGAYFILTATEVGTAKIYSSQSVRL